MDSITRRVNYLSFGNAVRLLCVKCNEETVHTKLRCCHCGTVKRAVVESIPATIRKVNHTLKANEGSKCR
jgi:hypothetical protein